jgi:hypothetical protein
VRPPSRQPAIVDRERINVICDGMCRVMRSTHLHMYVMRKKETLDKLRAESGTQLRLKGLPHE